MLRHASGGPYLSPSPAWAGCTRLLGVNGDVRAFCLAGSSMMFPRQVTCQLCGREAIVVAWLPFATEADGAVPLNQRKLNELNCRIDCAQCGKRIQLVALVFPKWLVA